MKNFLISVAFCSLSTWICAQDTSAEKHFVALYTVGESWDVEKQPNEQSYFKEHSAFLSQLRKEKNIVIGARYSDTGMLVLKAKDLETVKELLHQDIAIQHKLFNVIIHPFNPFYKGCIE
ncbi:hypothetical protein HME9304_01298 [Flagellimonas maritima]|uniref:YCII-related domain-containing protein n=1 Tax=Flagellimonas maritima TaxID=1383885 RepID=A0A2Z4LSH8_9FLAO|nr:hypothetical protein [Allomuricauda aurantiaca]AWX44298.1 hypothetical protein HME9304_01298 [Allomuricauda aurantiaca]